MKKLLLYKNALLYRIFFCSVIHVRVVVTLKGISKIAYTGIFPFIKGNILCKHLEFNIQSGHDMMIF